MQCGEYAAALKDLDLADTALHGSSDPLRVPQYAVIRLDSQLGAGLEPDRTLVQRVEALTERRRLTADALDLAGKPGFADLARRAKISRPN